MRGLAAWAQQRIEPQRTLSTLGSSRALLLPNRRLGLLDLLLATGVAALSGFLSGSRTWAGFNSPDSEFYATLALFGHDVTDRAIEPSYYWTRLGYIAPVRLLTTLLGPWAGFAAWRFILLWIIAFSVAWVVMRSSNRALGLIAALLATTNTMVLSYVGNTYVTGTVLAALSLVIAFGIWTITPGSRPPWLPSACTGMALAWLAMLNPYGCLLGLSIWVALRVLGLGRATPDNEHHAPRGFALRRDIAALVGFGTATFAAFLLAGRVLFREFEWFSTYLFWSSRLDQADFASDPLVWTRDIALLVPLAAIAAAVIVGLISRWQRPAVISLVLACVNAGFALAYVLLVPGPTLESSYYIAMLWPASLISLALSAAAIIPEHLDRLGAFIVLVVGISCCVLAIRAGSSQEPFPASTGIAWLLLWLGLFALASLLWRRMPSLSTPGAWLGLACAAVGILALGGSMITAQYLQNGRGSIGWFSQYPFASAYVDLGAEDAMRAKVRVQQWLLDRTQPSDRIAIWTDPDRLMSAVAAMQLWGADNLVTGAATLGRDDANRLQAMRPSVIAMYAPTRQQIDAFYASIPAWAQPSPLECIDVSLPDPRVASSAACITRLTWLI